MIRHRMMRINIICRMEIIPGTIAGTAWSEFGDLVPSEAGRVKVLPSLYLPDKVGIFGVR